MEITFLESKFLRRNWKWIILSIAIICSLAWSIEKYSELSQVKSKLTAAMAVMTNDKGAIKPGYEKLYYEDYDSAEEITATQLQINFWQRIPLVVLIGILSLTSAVGAGKIIMITPFTKSWFTGSDGELSVYETVGFVLFLGLLFIGFGQIYKEILI